MDQKGIEQLKRHEGLRLHAYADSLGYTTIGYGRMIDKRKGGGITKDEAECLLANDIARVEREIADLLPDDEPRRAVLINMAFQMGPAGLRKFAGMLSAVKSENWELAAKLGMQSRWADQTPRRAYELMTQLRTGEWQS